MASTTANFPKIICRVKALYAFSSSEKSSLSFEKGEFIEVLSQLDSGWWDGWCKGSRGWFPSNYVQIVDLAHSRSNRSLANQCNPSTDVSDIDTDVYADNEDDYDSDDDSQEEARTISLIKSMNLGQHPANSLPTTTPQHRYSQQPRNSPYMSNSPSTAPYLQRPVRQQQHEEQETSLPEGWTLQIADDGITKFYFNQHTGGLRWNHPSLLDSDDEHEHSSNDAHSSISLPPPRNPNRYSTTQLENFDDYSVFGKQKTRSNIPAIHLPESPISSGEQHLMQFWTRRTTPQGKVYYGNSITHETTWDFDDINPATGQLKRRNSEAEDVVEEKEQKEASSCTDDADDDMPMTWKTIAIEIAQSVQDLNNSIVQAQDSDIFKQKVVVVVDAVRHMLYSSHSMDRDAPHLQDFEAREPLRIVLSTLAKLILSAKVVNEPNNEILSRVQRDATDVLNAVRRFILVCQSKNVRIEHTSPKFVVLDHPFNAEGGEGGGKSSLPSFATPQQTKGKYPLNQDLIVSLQTHAKQILGSTNALWKASAYTHTLEKQQGGVVETSDLPSNEEKLHLLNQKTRSNVIILFQNLSSQTGSYLAILKDIDISHADATKSQSLPEFRNMKQKLYNSVGLLFSAVQTLTDTRNNLAASIAAIEEYVAAIEEAIETIFSNIVQMVGERKIWLMRNGDVRNNEQVPRSPVQSYFEIDNKKNSSMAHRESVSNNETASTESSISLETSSAPIFSRLYNRKNSQSGSQLSEQQQQQQQQQQIASSYRPSISSSNVSTSSLTRPSDHKALKRQFSFGHGGNSQDESELWYLGYDYAESDIEFTQDKAVKGGTLRALVERLTLHDFIDMSFIANFLLTYRSFCTTEEFVDLLQERYNLAPPAELTPDELEIWTERKQKLVRLRVFNVMKNWLENYYNNEDEFILDKLQFFANTVICDSSSFSAEQLNRLIKKRRELDANGGGLKKLIPNAMYGPMPIIPKNMQHIRLLDTDPLELARQLTIMDFKLYSSIQPIECLGKAWSRDYADNAANVKLSIDYCNRLTSWVTGSILSNKEAKKRVVVIKHWSQVANRCLEMQNYNTCMAILSAFDNSAIGRLKKTWELVSSRTSQSLAHIRKLMGSNRNFTEYREMIHSVNPPCIPFLGIYLQDLTFIEDGNPDLLKKSSTLINFAKQQKAAEVIREIKQFQSPPYTFQIVPEIQDYINFQLETSRDVDFLYERSLELEPRVAHYDNTV
ncbi:ras guanine nucleotide exchange factor domain-containing protein [Parasitella parasitica]|nr:ras guanine nucleotide exchange factor domain-containing protein [Parasitella parasitica]